MRPAIVLSSHTMGLSVIRALGKTGVPVVVFYYENNDMGYVSRYVSESFSIPHPEMEGKKFVARLVEKASRFAGGLLIPADDATLLIVSKNKTLLSKYYVVACTEWEITERVIDKKFTYDLAGKIGVAIPKTFVPHSVDEVRAFSSRVDYPFLIKPCQSHRYFEKFRKKMEKVENIGEAIEAYRQASGAGLEVMLQELIPGEDTAGVNYNSYYWGGQPLIEATAEKVRLSPPSFGVPRVVISKCIPEILAPGRRILLAMGYYGFSCTEFKKDSRDGIYKFLEVNGRYNRSGLLSLRCGINFPWLEYAHLINGNMPAPVSSPEGIYWIDEFRDIAHSLKYSKIEREPLAWYLRPYFHRNVFAVFDSSDPLPFLKRCFDILKMGLVKK